MVAQFIITIDTEEDSWGDYQRTGHRVDNILRIPRLQEVFDRYGALPTYLINWPVIMDDKACDILKSIQASGRCEIGTHCHPWNTPPFEEEINSANTMMCQLPKDLVREKLTRLTEATVQRLGIAPTAFRTGRWGFGADVAQALIENGYKVDTSVSPLVDWGDDFGPDYLRAPQRPYRFSPDDIMAQCSDGPLVEIPASVGFLQGADRVLSRLRRLMAAPLARCMHLIGVFERLHLMNFRWLSPELSPAKDMIALARTLLRKRCPTLNLSFHSTTLLPGKSPYVRTEKDLDHFLNRIGKVLEFAVENNLEFSTLSAAPERIHQLNWKKT